MSRALPSLVFALALAPSAALAQSARGELPTESLEDVPVEYAKETFVDFGALELGGVVQGPDLKLVDGVLEPGPHQNMIRVRISFDDMMAESVAQVR